VDNRFKVGPAAGFPCSISVENRCEIAWITHDARVITNGSTTFPHDTHRRRSIFNPSTRFLRELSFSSNFSIFLVA